MSVIELPATADANGAATFSLIQGPSLGSWWATIVQVPAALPGAIFTLICGGRVWAQWAGGSAFGPLELSAGDAPIAIMATGLSPGQSYIAVMHYSVSQSSPGVMPFPIPQSIGVAGNVDITGSSVDITGPVTVNTGSNDPIDFQVSTNQQFLGSFQVPAGGYTFEAALPPWAEAIVITSSFISGGVTSPAPVQIKVEGATTGSSLPVPKGGYVNSSGGSSFSSAWLVVPIFGSIDFEVYVLATPLDSGGSTPTVSVTAVARAPVPPPQPASSITWIQESTTAALTVLPASSAYSAFELLSVNWSLSGASNTQPAQLEVIGGGGGTVDTLQGPTLTTSGGQVTSSLDLHGLVVPAGGLVQAPKLTVAGTWQGTLTYRQLI